MRTMWQRGATVLMSMVLLLAGIGVAPAPVRAATLTVGNGEDSSNAGQCANAANTTCTLREAISVAAAGDTITFAVGVTVVTLTSGQLTLGQDVTITGPTGGTITVARSQVSGTPTFLIFGVSSGVTANLSNLTISGGNNGGNNGGGLYNNGTTALTNVTVRGNSTGGGGGNGGGIYASSGTLTLTNVTVSDNTASYGGGIYANSGAVRLTNVTVSGNTSIFTGGGIRNLNSTMTLTNVTVSGNSTGGGGGGGIRNGGTLNATNSIIAGNTNNDNLSGSITSSTNNITSGDPLLASLGNYGGPTQTRPPLPGSPAINAGNATACADAATVNNVDQRGVSRAAYGPCDLGAVESRSFVFGAATGDGQTAAVNTAFAQPLAVRVYASFGEPVEGGKVTFAGPPNGAGLAAPVTATITGGAASATVTANGVAGGYTAVATANGVNAFVPFNLTNTGAATTFTFAGLPSVVSATVPQTVTITARDANGAVATGYTGTVQLTDTAMLGFTPQTVAFASADKGVKTVTVTFTAGSGAMTTFRATDATTSNITGSQSVAVRAAPPRIAGYTPNRSTAGQTATVTITGTGFGTGAAAATVTFDNTAVTVTNVSATSLTVAVPTTLPSGTYTIKVTNPADGQSATSGPFAVYPATGVPAAPGMRAVPGSGGGGMAPAPAPALREPAGGSGNGPSGAPALGGEATLAATPLPAPSRR